VLEATLKGDVDTNLYIVTQRIDEKMKSAKTGPPT
jgi:hypothetical protein